MYQKPYKEYSFDELQVILGLSYEPTFRTLKEAIDYGYIQKKGLAYTLNMDTRENLYYIKATSMMSKTKSDYFDSMDVGVLRGIIYNYIKNNNTELSLKELQQILDLSYEPTYRYLKQLSDLGFVKHSVKENQTVYNLNTENEIIKELMLGIKFNVGILNKEEPIAVVEEQKIWNGPVHASPIRFAVPIILLLVLVVGIGILASPTMSHYTGKLIESEPVFVGAAPAKGAAASEEPVVSPLGKSGPPIQPPQVPQEEDVTITPSIKDSHGSDVSASVRLIDNSINSEAYNSHNGTHQVRLKRGSYNAEITLSNKHVKSIELVDIQLSENTTELIKVDDVSAEKAPADSVSAYAIDPTMINFTSGTVIVTAEGNELYKCKDWDFINQVCNGEWAFLRTIIPGENYTFNLTPEDPAFAEIIVITKAARLNENRTFISDIYEQVKEQDNVWSEQINENEYIRVTFEKELTSENDITIFPRTISGTPRIEVYEENGSELIAQFTSIIDNEYNKVYLTNLTGTQDTFDLKILGGTIEIDHIIDPMTNVVVNFTANETWTVPAGVTSITVEAWGGGGRGGTRTTNGVGGGGGGGAYSSSNISVTPGANYSIVVGLGGNDTNVNGKDSYFNSTTTLLAKGGSGVANNTATGGAGGASASGVGTVRYNGGNGATGSGSNAGGGGGGAGSTGAGGNASGSTAGTGTSELGGSGGAGRSGSQGNGVAGSVYGGGGGGGYRSFSGTRSGGTGAQGILRITYAVYNNTPPVTTLVSPTNGGTSTSNNITFSCNATDDFQLTNMTLYWNYSGGWTANSTNTLTGTSNSTTFQKTGLSNGVILWNCMACDNDSQCSFAAANWTVTVNFNNPPTQTTPILNSTTGNNYTTDNLTCYNQSTADAEGNPVKNIYNWYRNGTSIPVFNMPFEGGSNSTWTKDYSGYHNNATVNNATWNATGGYDGKGAYMFNSPSGINSSITTVGNINITGTASRTITFWVYPKNTNRGGLVELGTDGNGQRFGVAIRDNNWFLWGYGTGNDWSTGIVPNTNVWSFHAITYNGTTARWFIDGTEINNSFAIVSNLTNTQVQIGFENDSGTLSYFNGTLDDIMIFNYTLTIAEIQALYQNKTNTILTGRTAEGDNWSCEVTPNDIYADGTTLSSNNVSVRNLYSNLVSPANGNVTTSNNVSFTCNATDAVMLTNMTLYWNYSGTWLSNGTTTVSGTANNTTFQHTGLNNGAILWNCLVCNNRSACYFAPTNWTVTVNYVPNTAPNTTTPTIYPATAYKTDNLYCNATLNDTQQSSLTAYWRWFKNGIVNLTGTKAATNNSNTNITVLTSGNLTKNDNWTCEVTPNDGALNGTAKNASIVISNSATTIPTSLTPTTGTYGGTSSIIPINCSGSTDADTSDTIIYFIGANDSGTWHVINTGTGIYSWDISALTSQVIDINCTAGDGTVNTSSFNPAGTITIDNTKPIPTIVAPVNASTDVDGNIYFNCSATDNLALSTISLYINGALNQTRTVSGTSNYSEFNLTGIADGAYTWYCRANDSVNNFNVSDIYNLTVSRPAQPIYTNYTSGNSTNWSSLPDITNVCNGTAIVDSPSMGQIRWLNCVNASAQNFDANINISNNFVSVNFGLNPTFNASAELTIRNLTWSDTEDFNILIDGQICPNTTCTNVFYDNNTGALVFDVGHFTNFSTSGTSTLIVWDQNDTNMPKANRTACVGNTIEFFANYSRLVLGSSTPNTGATCTINFTDSAGNTMTYNATSLFYEYSRIFSSTGVKNYNVTCVKTTFPTRPLITVTDSIDMKDCNPPTWSNNQSSIPAAYSATPSVFNVTWTDNINVSTAWIEGNWSGIPTNYSMALISGNTTSGVWSYNITLGAGTYYWRSHANDTSNNWNSTPINWTFTIAKANNPVTLSLNGTQGNNTYTYPAAINATGTATAGTVNIYRDEVSIASGASPQTSVAVLANGTYAYKVNATGNANYTDNSTGVTYYAFVNKATSTCSLTFNPQSPQTYGTSITATCSCTNPEVGAKLYRNNNDVTISENGTAIGLGAGTWNYVCNVTSSANYTSATNSSSYIINKAPNPVMLLLNGSAANLTVIYGQTSNASAYATNGTTVYLYRNSSLIASGVSPQSEIATLGVGLYVYKTNATGTSNYLDNSTGMTWNLTVSPATSTCSLTFDKTSPQNYGTNLTATCNCTISGVLYRNGSNVNATENGAAKILAAGSWDYVCNTSENANYTSATNSSTFVIDKAPTLTRLFLNGTEGNRDYNISDVANFTVTLNVSGKTVYLDTNITGWVQQSSVTPLVNTTILSAIGRYNITGSFPGDTNYTASSTTYYANVLDTTAPIVHLVSPENNSITNQPSQTFNCNITDNYQISNLTLYVWNSTGALVHTNTSQLSGTTNSSSYIYTLPYDNNFVWSCLGFDVYGNSNWANEGNHTITLDATNPSVTIISPANQTYNTTSIMLNTTITDTHLAVCWYSIDNWATNTTYNCSSGTIVAAEGATTLRIAANDTVGNSNTSVVYFTVDTIAPTITINSPGNQTYNTSSVWFNATVNEAASWCGYSLDGAANVTMSNSSTTIWYNLSTVLNGNRNVVFYCNDSIGHMNYSTTTYFTVDTVPPAITIISPISTLYNSSVVLVNASITDATTSISYAVAEVNGTVNITLTQNGNYWSNSIYSFADGNNTIRIYANDSANNWNVSEVNFTVDTLAPSVSIIYPLGHSIDITDNVAVVLDINETDIDTIYANITSPNTTVYQITGFSTGLKSDNFDTNTEGINWVLSNITSPGQVCYGDIDGTVADKMYMAVDGGSGPDLAQCSFNSIKKVDGDFDTNITFNITNFEEDSFFTFRTSSTDSLAGMGTRAYIVVIKEVGGNISYRFGYNNGTTTYSQVIPGITESYGKMRIRMYNTTGTPKVNLYFWNNTAGAWVSTTLESGNISLPTSTRTQYIQIKPGSQGATWGTINLTLDDFYLTGDNYRFALFDSNQIGRHNVTIFVNDSFGRINNTELTWFNVTTQNHPPSKPFVITPAENSFVRSVYNITWSAAIDPDANSLRYNVTLLNPDKSFNATIVSDYGYSNTTYYTWNTTVHPDGLYNIKVVAYENETIEQFWSYDDLDGNFTIDNTIPIYTNPINTSNNFRRYENFTANMTLNDNIQLDYYIFSTNASGNWSNKTVNINGAQYNASEQANITVVKGSVMCWYYWENDSAGNINSSGNYCFAAQNTIPSITSVNVTPDTAYTNNDLTCTVSGWSDADNDSEQYYYEWRNGTSLMFTYLSASTINVLTNGNTTKGDVWNCTVKPYDNESNGTAYSDTVTILNSIPTTPTSLTPETGLYGGTNNTIPINCSGSTDNDSTDVIAYNIDAYNGSAWYALSSSDPDGLYNWDISNITSQVADLRCNATDGTSQSAYYDPTGNITIDNTPVLIEFISPTPDNATVYNYYGTVIINTSVTNNVAVDTCIFNWNGANETMIQVGSGSAINCYSNKTNLTEGNYSYKVFANDTVGLWNVSETRNVTINYPPEVIIYHPLGDEPYDEDNILSISINAADKDGIDTAIAQVSLPNTTNLNFTLGYGQQSDDFEIDTVNSSWHVDNTTTAPGQTCTADIDTTIPGKAYTYLSGDGSPNTDTYCGLVSDKPLDGDFDINVTFDILNKSSQDIAINFKLSDFPYNQKIQKYILMSIGNWSGYNQTFDIFVENGTISEYIFTEARELTAGSFRITRVGNNFTFYTYNETNSTWVEEISYEIVIDRLLYITLESETAAYGWGDMGVSWDNLGIKSNSNSTFVAFNVSQNSGNYSIIFFVNDTLGAMNSMETSNFTVLAINDAPTTPFIIAPVPGLYLRNDYNITWYPVHDEENNAVQFNITLLNSDYSVNQSLLTNYGNLNSTYYTWDTTTSPDGVYSLDVLVYENDTVEMYSKNYTLIGTFTIDNTEPQIGFVPNTTVTGIYARSYIQANVSASDLNFANLTVYLYNSTGLVNSSSSVSSNYFINFTGLPDANYYLNATATDLAGNMNATTAINITLDTTKPNIQFVSPSTPAGTIAQNFIVANVSAIDPHLDMVMVHLHNASGMNVTINYSSSSSSPLFVNFTGLSDGLYYLHANANDTVNNTNYTEVRSVELDSTPPIITVLSPLNQSYNTSTVWFNATANEGIDVWRVNYNGTNVTTIDNTLEVTPDGTYQLYVYAKDYAELWGINGSIYFTVDTAAPVWSSNSTSPASPVYYSPGANYQFNITWTDATTNVNDVVFEFNGVNYTYLNTQVSKSGDVYSITLIDLAANESGYSYKWYANDSVGNLNSTPQQSYLINKIVTSTTLYLNGSSANATYNLGESANFTAIVNVSGKTVYINSNIPGWVLQSGITQLINITSLNAGGIFNVTGYFTGDVNYSASSETWFVNVSDLQAPTILSPDARPNPANQTNTVNITADVTDNGAIDYVWVVLGYPNSTVVNYTLALDGGDKWYFEVLDTYQPGLYSYSIWANDTAGNTQNTASYTFAVNDVTAPTVNSLTTPGTTINQTNSIEVAVNVTDLYNDSVDVVVVQFKYPNGTAMNFTLAEVGDTQKFNMSFTDTMQPGRYNVTFFGNDTAGNSNIGTTYFIVADVTAPSVTDLIITPSTINQTNTTEIAVNITDYYWNSVNTVRANVSWDSASEIVTLTFNGTHYVSNFSNTGYAGIYNVLILANDTAGNLNNTVSTNFTVNDVMPPQILSTSPAQSQELPAGTSSTTLTAITNEQAICRFSTNSTVWENMTQFTTTNSTTHSELINGLTNAGSYTYYILCQDLAGNNQTSVYTLSFSVGKILVGQKNTGLPPAPKPPARGVFSFVEVSEGKEISISPINVNPLQTDTKEYLFKNTGNTALKNVTIIVFKPVAGTIEDINRENKVGWSSNNGLGWSYSNKSSGRLLSWIVTKEFVIGDVAPNQSINLPLSFNTPLTTIEETDFRLELFSEGKSILNETIPVTINVPKAGVFIDRLKDGTIDVYFVVNNKGLEKDLNNIYIEFNLNHGKETKIFELFGPYTVKAGEIGIFTQNYKINQKLEQDKYEVTIKVYNGFERIGTSYTVLDLIGNNNI